MNAYLYVSVTPPAPVYWTPVPSMIGMTGARVGADGAGRLTGVRPVTPVATGTATVVKVRVVLRTLYE